MSHHPSGQTDRNDDLPVRDFESATWPVKVPQVLRVVRRGAKPARLYIDGEPFGYATDGGFTVGPTGKHLMPRVTFTLVGYRVEVVDDAFAVRRLDQVGDDLAADDAPATEPENTP